MKKKKLFDIPIKTVDWIKDGDFMLISNGVDNIARLDGTNKEVNYEAKKASFAVYHKGKVWTKEDFKDIMPE